MGLGEHEQARKPFRMRKDPVTATTPMHKSHPFGLALPGVMGTLVSRWPAAVLVIPALGFAGPGALGAEPAAPPQNLPIEARWCPAGANPAGLLGSAHGGSSAAGGVKVPGGAAAPPASPGPCVALEVPRTWHQYTLGLQLRPPLPAGRGMWFAYRPAQVARFWMHRTPQPLDMVFVRNARVIAIEPAAAPCMRLPCPSYGPDEPVDGVLELAAGQAAQRGLKVGSPLRVELLRSFGPKAPAPD